MKLRVQTTRHTSYLIAAVVILLVCFYAGAPEWVPGVSTLHRLELMAFDWRVRKAADQPAPTANQFGFVDINNDSISELAIGMHGDKVGLYWPRSVYGRVVRELTAQNARVVAFDVLFGELRPDHAPVKIGGNEEVSSDEFFALQTRTNSRVILAAANGLVPPPLFRTNAWKLGHIEAPKDSDGVLRRALPFVDIRDWNPNIRVLMLANSVVMSNVVVESHRIKLPNKDGKVLILHLDAQRRFDFFEALAILQGERPPGRKPAMIPAFVDRRVWNLGIVAAARMLKLDLDRVEFDPTRNTLTFRGPGVERTVQLDEDGTFPIDWSIRLRNRRLVQEGFENLLIADKKRQEGEGREIQEIWRGKVAFIGSTATGNDLTDRGATPLEKETELVSKHWNVANMFLTNRFIQRMDYPAQLALLAALGALASLITWKLRAPWGTIAILAGAGVLLLVALQLYVRHRYWMPVVLPVLGSLLLNHVALVTYQVIFEQREKRHIRGVFSKLVSPNVVNELLSAETLNLGGARRNITVLFADVRGFTTLTDTNQANAEAYVKEHNLAGPEAEAYFDEQARETLDTVNIYLATIADRVKEHDGTLDKYIGDCVMAFWGAPIANERHAVACVRCAVAAQRAMWELNEQRFDENQRRDAENKERTAAGQPRRPLLARLALGTGINSGVCIVGLMGSVQHTFSYTVFGREVNLASRLEGVSGRGRVIIGEATYNDLVRFDPDMARTCAELEPVHVKGIEKAVRIYEVPWRTPEMLAREAARAAAAPAPEAKAAPAPEAAASH